MPGRSRHASHHAHACSCPRHNHFERLGWPCANLQHARLHVAPSSAAALQGRSSLRTAVQLPEPAAAPGPVIQIPSNARDDSSRRSTVGRPGQLQRQQSDEDPLAVLDALRARQAAEGFDSMDTDDDDDDDSSGPQVRTAADVADMLIDESNLFADEAQWQQQQQQQQRQSGPMNGGDDDDDPASR